MHIRFADINDLEQLVKIYNQAIIAGGATADMEPFTVTSRLPWFNDHQKDRYPIYVVELENHVIGYGCLSAYRKGRGALDTTAEISYYIDYDYHGRGIGKFLISYMMNDCDRLGLENLLAILIDVNRSSRKILENFGFKEWGLLPNVVNVNGIICNHLIMGINL